MKLLLHLVLGILLCFFSAEILAQKITAKPKITPKKTATASTAKATTPVKATQTSAPTVTTEPTPAATKPFKSASTVIILTKESPEVAFKNISELLYKFGYDFKTEDKDSLKLITDEKPIYNINVRLVSRTKKVGQFSQISLQGEYMEPLRDADFKKIVYNGVENTPVMRTWTNMMDVALMYTEAIAKTEGNDKSKIDLKNTVIVKTDGTGIFYK